MELKAITETATLINTESPISHPAKRVMVHDKMERWECYFGAVSGMSVCS